MTFHTFSIMFLSSDSADHVKPEMSLSIFHRWVNTAKRSAFQQNVCTHLATNLHQVHSHSYSSQYFCQLVQKYPLFRSNYNSRTWWYISSVAASQDIQDSRLCVAFSKCSLNFSILSYYREPDRATRWIKEAIHIRKEGQQTMSHEEGSYQLSHTYDCFLGTRLTYCAKNRKKKWLFSFSWRRLLVEVETLRYKQFFGRNWWIYYCKFLDSES